MFLRLQIMIKEQEGKLRNCWQKYVHNERGDMVATIGWMALTAVILVLIYNLLQKWLPGFVEGITNKLDSIVEPMD